MVPIMPPRGVLHPSAGRSLLGSRIGLQGLGCADQYQGPAILVFRRRLHLIARKIADDGVLPAQRKMEGIPIDRDLAVARRAGSVQGGMSSANGPSSPCELHRVYPPLADDTGTGNGT